jgi:hypothetical protein
VPAPDEPVMAMTGCLGDMSRLASARTAPILRARGIARKSASAR